MGQSSGEAPLGQGELPLLTSRPMATVEVSEQVQAPTDRVWDLISDPTHMSDLTAECMAMKWTGDPPRRPSGPGSAAATAMVGDGGPPPAPSFVTNQAW